MNQSTTSVNDGLEDGGPLGVSDIQRVFPDSVICLESRMETADMPIYPEESVLIEKAIEKRKREFTCGRHLARQALERLGVTHFPVLANPDRSPIWPPGITGSISHTDGYCGVAAAKTDRIKSVGFDAEWIHRFESRLWKHICTETELEFLQSIPHPSRREYAAVIFSAKESFYKCQHQMSNAFLGFQDVDVLIDDAKRIFEIRLNRADLRNLLANVRVEGRYGIQGNLALAGVVLH